jgi:hypothetical protein
MRCYNHYLATQRGDIRCFMCRQFEICEVVWRSLSTIFNFDWQEVFELEDISADAQLYARAFQRGEVTDRQIYAREDAILAQRAALVHVRAPN